MAFKFPTGAPKSVQRWFDAKGLKPSFHWSDVWKQEHQVSFTVAKAMELDILTDIRDGVAQALKEGQTFAQFKKDLKPLLQKKGWWGQQEVIDPVTKEKVLSQLGSTRRLKIIYDTNLRTAHATGQWDRIQRSKKSLPYLLYELGPSKEHRREHVRWSGVLLPADDSFWDTHFPQNGWGCKCRVRQTSKGEYGRIKGKHSTQAPTIKKREWTNQRTGEIMKIPEGIDPGWDYNPGKQRLGNSLKQMTDTLNHTDFEPARSAVRSLMAGDAFKRWYDQPEGNFPVGVMSHSDRQRIGAEVQTVELSRDTLGKQRREHPERSASEYRTVQQALDRGRVVQEGKSLIYVLESEGYVAVVKATRTGKGLFITSLRRFSGDEIKRDRELKRLMQKRGDN
ncbi:MAG: phage minor head protein [Endozoicomonas sp.]